MTKCTGCGQDISVHKTIEEHIACEAVQQDAVRAELDRQAAAEPKYDQRFLARNRRRSTK